MVTSSHGRPVSLAGGKTSSQKQKALVASTVDALRVIVQHLAAIQAFASNGVSTVQVG